MNLSGWFTPTGQHIPKTKGMTHKKTLEASLSKANKEIDFDSAVTLGYTWINDSRDSTTCFEIQVETRFDKLEMIKRLINKTLTEPVKVYYELYNSNGEYMKTVQS